MRVFALVVTRNECDRYLQSCLAWHVPMFDGVLVYDDRSEDATREVVLASGARFTERPLSVPTFMEHEGRFRQDSLQALEESFGLVEGDWVMVVDTDEFLVADARPTDEVVRQVVALADRRGCKSVLIDRPELWSLDPPAERMDGYWGAIRCTRLFRWEPGGVLQDKAMGCGNEPTYINSAPIFRDPTGLRLFHVGYVDAQDRQEKYDRYSSLLNHGHNDRHIESILGSPTLKVWSGHLPPIWRGIRDTA